MILEPAGFSRQERTAGSFLPTESEWIQLLNRSSGVHLGCPWNCAALPPQGDWWCWKGCASPMQNTSSTDKILHLFHFSFFENLEFHLYFRRPRVMLYLSPNRILEFQWSLSRQKFSRIVFKGKGNFSLSEKQCFSQCLK